MYFGPIFSFQAPANRFIFHTRKQHWWTQIKMSSSTTFPEEQNNEDSSETPPPLKKVHHFTVCMVPPPKFRRVWDTVGAMRIQLKDPGYYRWPPHANMLYPFLELDEASLSNTLELLHSAALQCNPFSVALNKFGTFGGKQRGVLWLFPDSRSEGDDINLLPPLMNLHKMLEDAFPLCKDLSGKGFNPHMTISHFKDLNDALTAQKQLESDFPNIKLDFIMDRFYLLERKGDGGQFLRVAEVGLGINSSVKVFHPPEPFPHMPTEEEAWVYEERMKLKKRRNGGNRGGRGRKNVRRERTPRVPDTPEEIARKRAERKAKRLEMESKETNQAPEVGPSTDET